MSILKYMTKFHQNKAKTHIDRTHFDSSIIQDSKEANLMDEW